MRRVTILLASALIVFALMTAWARWDSLHPLPPEARLSTDPASWTPGQDQARVVVREVRLIHGGQYDDEEDPVDAIQGTSRNDAFAFLVEMDVQDVLRGRFPRGRLRIMVHSPSADLGVSRAGQAGVLHRHREGSGGRYEFRPDPSQPAKG